MKLLYFLGAVSGLMALFLMVLWAVKKQCKKYHITFKQWYFGTSKEGSHK